MYSRQKALNAFWWWHDPPLALAIRQVGGLMPIEPKIAGYYQFRNGRLVEITKEEYEAHYRNPPRPNPRPHQSKRRRKW
jgi:hypothetical protein